MARLSVMNGYEKEESSNYLAKIHMLLCVFNYYVISKSQYILADRQCVSVTGDGVM